MEYKQSSSNFQMGKKYHLSISGDGQHKCGTINVNSVHELNHLIEDGFIKI